MLIEAFAIWPNEGQAILAIAGSNLTGVDNAESSDGIYSSVATLFIHGHNTHTLIARAHAPIKQNTSPPNVSGRA